MVKTFMFNDEQFYYFSHNYNRTGVNERIVEIPIMYAMYNKLLQPDVKLLEIGNVLKHYYPSFSHDVLDKYEKADKVMNVDIVDFKPEKKYDVIISISTLEHVGFDESGRNAEKFVIALKNIKKNVLKENGVMYFTVPFGYNPVVDRLVREQTFTKQYYMKRKNAENEWEQTSYEEIKDCKYGRPFGFASAVVIGVVENTIKNEILI